MNNGMLSVSLLWAIFVATAAGQPPIERRVPPPGIALPAEQRQEIQEQLARVKQRLRTIAGHALEPDIEILSKAVDYALQHGEFYRPHEDFRLAIFALELAKRRIDDLLAGNPQWTTDTGLVLRGYRSRIDDSVQPYGLVIPQDLKRIKPVPLYVWLHGRGDKITDLHFIQRRLSRTGAVLPADAIVLHPFGRQCIGFKSAGEIDVLEAIEHVAGQYPIDRDRIVLMGFSMGGAGAWHLGAHYADRWVALNPGAGFAETAKYNQLKPQDYPPWYEQQLWGLYDVPHYVRNLFNLPVVAYSGENDKQIQSVRVMEDAYRRERHVLPHVIGPGTGHRIEPGALAEVMRYVDQAVQRGREHVPRSVSLQTRTLRYSKVFWVEALGLDEHWREARIDAEMLGPRSLRVTTKNVSSLRLTPWQNPGAAQLEIDGQQLGIHVTGGAMNLTKIPDGWRPMEPDPSRAGLRKRPGLQGPIDDVFQEPFLVVTPTGKAYHDRVQNWVDFELAHFQSRWQALFRGDLRTKTDVEVDEEDLSRYHLILWGDPSSNRILGRITARAESAHRLPMEWTSEQLRIGTRAFTAESHVPVMIYPNPLQATKYVVINSGPTFREAHDRTNSLQNPKLPDWAIVDLDEPPTDKTPGRIAAADFFDEQWRIKESRSPESRAR